MFGEKLKELLDKKHISAYRLNKITGIHQSTISSYVTGREKNPRLDILIKIADALDISLDEFREKKE